MMNELYDFFVSALPWIAIGLYLACSILLLKAKRKGTELSRFFKGLCWTPSVCCLAVAVMEMLDGNKSSGTTWLMLAIFNAVSNFGINSENNNKAGE